jgi:hypothetical protein
MHSRHSWLASLGENGPQFSLWKEQTAPPIDADLGLHIEKMIYSRWCYLELLKTTLLPGYNVIGRSENEERKQNGFLMLKMYLRHVASFSEIYSKT